MQCPWVLVFGLGIPRGGSTILWNFLRWSFVFSRISKDEVTNLKIPGIFWKKYVSTTPVWIFFWNSPIMLKYGQLDSPHFRWWVQVGYQFKMTPDFKKIMKKVPTPSTLPIITCCKRVQKKTLWPLFMDGVQLPQGKSHLEKEAYFFS